jgi:hypothetical protein
MESVTALEKAKRDAPKPRDGTYYGDNNRTYGDSAEEHYSLSLAQKCIGLGRVGIAPRFSLEVLSHPRKLVEQLFALDRIALPVDGDLQVLEQLVLLGRHVYQHYLPVAGEAIPRPGERMLIGFKRFIYFSGPNGPPPFGAGAQRGARIALPPG